MIEHNASIMQKKMQKKKDLIDYYCNTMSCDNVLLSKDWKELIKKYSEQMLRRLEAIDVYTI